MHSLLANGLLLLLAASAAGCASTPPDLDLSGRLETHRHAFVVELVPPAVPAPINQIHAWQVKVARPDGTPVTHARITVDGGMPQHGHGLPTRPRVTREVADGTYLLDGMKFSMSGWWEIKLAITAAGATDDVTFNTVIGNDGAPR